jgi:chromosome segregation ATPase
MLPSRPCPMKLTPLLLVLAATALSTPLALSQTASNPAAKPAAKPAPKPAPKPAARPAAKAPAAAAPEKTATIGGGANAASAALPILTRDELRACLKQEEAIRVRLSEHEAARAPIDQERQGVTAKQEALRLERAQVDALATKTNAFRTKMEAHADRVAAWNRDVEAFNSRAPQGVAGERERVRINTEREGLQKAQTELEAERVAMAGDNEKIVASFNAKAKEVEAAVDQWNQRNKGWNEAGAKLEAERKGWVSACADRRYREDDEIAIKAGR